ncbi:MAG: DUF5320 domain-containing protein [Spirochaetia bacterium]|nr:DUF5320 domain-containing protein [Spirochaetia bacterium]
MPRGDRRGPNGMGAGRSQAHCSHMQPGPMTGRAAGFCSGSNAPGFANTGAVGGYGQGMGAGRGFGGGFHGAVNGAAYGRGMNRGQGRGMGIGFQNPNIAPVYSKETEKGYIENEVTILKDQLKALEGRLADMQEDE